MCNTAVDKKDGNFHVVQKEYQSTFSKSAVLSYNFHECAIFYFNARF
jgi:hypothetical protein